MPETGKISTGKLALGLALCLVGLTWLSLAVSGTYHHVSANLDGQHAPPINSEKDYAGPLILVGVGAHIVVQAIRRK